MPRSEIQAPCVRHGRARRKGLTMKLFVWVCDLKKRFDFGVIGTRKMRKVEPYKQSRKD